MGIATQIQGGPVTIPGGENLPGVEIRCTLVDAVTHRPVSAVDAPTSAIKVGTKTATADENAMVDFTLWPNSRGEKQTLYAVLVNHADVRSVFVSVPESDVAITWLELITSGDPLDPSEETALQQHIADDDRHLTTIERAALDAASDPSGTNPLATMNDIAAAGGGDMMTLIYDPRGIADDTFDLNNLTGNLDGGVF